MRLRICVFAPAAPARLRNASIPTLAAGDPAFRVPRDPGGKIQVRGTVTLDGGRTYEKYGLSQW